MWNSVIMHSSSYCDYDGHCVYLHKTTQTFRHRSLVCNERRYVASLCISEFINAFKVVCFWLIIFIYLGFYVAFNTVQVISRWVVGRAEETSTYSSLGLCTVNCRPMASNYQLSHLRPSRGSNLGLRGGILAH